jgi:hypothetical protein
LSSLLAGWVGFLGGESGGFFERRGRKGVAEDAKGEKRKKKKERNKTFPSFQKINFCFKIF